jgi:colicin import membrane protein
MSGLPGMHSDKTKARALALAMHAAFIVLLVFGVSWQKKPESPVVADLWSSLPPMAQPKVDVAPEPEPEPPPKPAPRVAPPPPKAEPAPAPKPEIVVKAKEKEKPKPVPKVEPKPEPKKLDQDKIDKALRAKEDEAKKKREQELNAEIKKEKDAAEAKAAAQAAAAKAEMQKYIDGIKLRVQREVIVPPNIQGNPEAEVVITLIPGGELLDVQIKKRSGNAAYDDAIERAIRRAQPFVVPSGEQFQRHFRQFTMAFRPIQ